MSAECFKHGTDMYYREGEWQAPSGCHACDVEALESRVQKLEAALLDWYNRYSEWQNADTPYMDHMGSAFYRAETRLFDLARALTSSAIDHEDAT